MKVGAGTKPFARFESVPLLSCEGVEIRPEDFDFDPGPPKSVRFTARLRDYSDLAAAVLRTFLEPGTLLSLGSFIVGAKSRCLVDWVDQEFDTRRLIVRIVVYGDPQFAQDPRADLSEGGRGRGRGESVVTENRGSLRESP